MEVCIMLIHLQCVKSPSKMMVTHYPALFYPLAELLFCGNANNMLNNMFLVGGKWIINFFIYQSFSGIPAAGTRACSTGNNSATNTGWVLFKLQYCTSQYCTIVWYEPFSCVELYNWFLQSATLTAIFSQKKFVQQQQTYTGSTQAC